MWWANKRKQLILNINLFHPKWLKKFSLQGTKKFCLKFCLLGPKKFCHLGRPKKFCHQGPKKFSHQGPKKFCLPGPKKFCHQGFKFLRKKLRVQGGTNGTSLTNIRTMMNPSK